MNSGPIATFGIMFSVTNSGSSISADQRDQLEEQRQRHSDDRAERKAAEDFGRCDQRVRDPGIVGDGPASRASQAARAG